MDALTYNIRTKYPETHSTRTYNYSQTNKYSHTYTIHPPTCPYTYPLIHLHVDPHKHIQTYTIMYVYILRVCIYTYT